MKLTLLCAATVAAAFALPAAADVTLTPGQLEAAGYVYQGTADCEFNQKVHVAPIDGQPGHFKLSYGNASYTVVPEETTTGAVRLEDKKNGIVWLQIPAKSMLMNAKLGRRLVDSCLHPEQRAAGVVASK
jgi:hypothetical protein